jgi:uncharacterized SAM-binding protein YcdF (DUF218 family)
VAEPPTKTENQVARRSVFVRAIGWALLACGLVFVVVFAYGFTSVWRQATREEARPADVIVVFGAAEYSGRPSPVFRARLDHALSLFRQNLAPTIITTGGMAWDPTFSEGGVGRDYLANKGVGDTHLIAETYSDNTAESAERVAIIMRKNGFRSCIAVSDPYHLFRIKRMMEAQGMQTYTSPRPQPGVKARTKVAHTLREAFSFTLWRLHLRFLVPDVLDDYFHKVK